MNATVDQIAKGIADYIDRELVPKVPGLRKWGLGFMGGRSAYLVQHYLNDHREQLVMMGIMSEDGMVDVDTIASEFSRIASVQGPVTEHIPIFGDVTFSSSDIDKLHAYIVG